MQRLNFSQAFPVGLRFQSSPSNLERFALHFIGNRKYGGILLHRCELPSQAVKLIVSGVYLTCRTSVILVQVILILGRVLQLSEQVTS